MKAFVLLYGVTLFLGTYLSMYLAREGWFFLPLYSIAVYQLYRLNYGKSFFLVFHEDPEKNEQVKIRLGQVELEIKDENDRAEQKFLELFDWKKSFVRRFLAWFLFACSMYLLFFRLKIELNVVTVITPVICLLIMRSVTIGHLIVPLGINLVVTLMELRYFNSTMIYLFVLYGVLVIFNLSLIYPSEERLQGKLRDWMKGKWFDVVKAAAIIVLTFSAGVYLFRGLNSEEKNADVKPQDIQEQLKKTDQLQSSLSKMMNKGLMQNPELLQKVKGHSEKLREMGQGQVSPQLMAKTLSEGRIIEKEFEDSLRSSPAPDVTPELLQSMIHDVKSRDQREVGPETYKKLQEFLKKAENFNGQGGSELVAEYRECKFGKGGYYREETEFDHSLSSERSSGFINDLKDTEEKKREIRKQLEKNIEELKSDSDESLLAVNKALKDELEALDNLSEEDRQKVRSELQRTSDLRSDLMARTKNEEMKKTLTKLEEESQQILREMTPHMNASDKAALAGKIEKHQENVARVAETIKDEIKDELRQTESTHANEESETDSDWAGKFLRMGTLIFAAAAFFWFMRLMKKDGVKKVRGISQADKDELARELSQVRKLNLSPREEVIHTYNVFHDGMKTLLFTNETPPSCIVYEGIKVAEPELERPTFTVTNTFARTFYGEKDVTLPELKSFRKDVRKVFSFFDITY